VAGIEGQIRHALVHCVDRLAGEWTREGGIAARCDKILVDAGFQSDTVYEFCRANGNATPAHGRGIGAGENPMHETRAKAGERLGFQTFETTAAGKRAIRYVLTDTNFWKSFIVARFRQPLGEPGALTLFGQSRRETNHDMIADHLTAERGESTTKKGRTVVEWELKPGRPDNHWLDGLVGCAAAASMVGVVLPGQTQTRTKSGMSLRQMQQAKLQATR
jgi:hypothetical protein